jgi:hypothetical protein
VIGAKYSTLSTVWWGSYGSSEASIGEGRRRETMIRRCFLQWVDKRPLHLLLVPPDGRVRAAYLNAPGTWHDSTNDRLLYEERGERRVILTLITLLYNYRAVTLGYNQIQSTFMPHLNLDANTYMFSS